MTDSTDSQALSSAPKGVAVAEPLTGMYVAGYVVLCFPDNTSERSVFYGMFKELEKAQAWADLLSGIVIIHPVHEPTTNRG